MPDFNIRPEGQASTSDFTVVPVVKPTGDPAVDLAAARKAWSDRDIAQRQVDRLNGYRHLSPGMKDDRQRRLREWNVANEALIAILAPKA